MITKGFIKTYKALLGGLGYTPKDKVDEEKFNDAMISTIQRAGDAESVHWILEACLPCLQNWKKIEKIFANPKLLEKWNQFEYANQDFLTLISAKECKNQLVYTNAISISENPHEEGFLTGPKFGLKGLPICYINNKGWIGTVKKNYGGAYFKLIHDKC